MSDVSSINYEGGNFSIKDAIAAMCLTHMLDSGPWNLLIPTLVTTQTVSGVKFTFNDDGSITADGTASNKKATANILFRVGEVRGHIGESLILSGCPAGGNYTSGYAVYADRITNSTTMVYQEDPLTEPTFVPDTDFRVRIMIRSGAVVDNVTFRPAVRDSKLTRYPVYVDGRRQTDPWLSTKSDFVLSGLTKLIDDGPKNALKVACGNKGVSGVSLTDNNDGSVTVDGTSTSTSSIILVSDLSSSASNAYDGRWTIPAGTYIVPYVADKIRIQVYEHSGTSSSMTALSNVTENGVFTYAGSKPYVTARILIEAGGSFDNFTFFPMISPLIYWLVSKTRVPYRPTYQELYDMVKALQNGT